MLYIKGECYCQYYFTSLFILFISYFDVVPYAQTFAIVYSHTYSTQSPNIALLSCLLRTLGIVLYLYTQYTQLLTSDSSCLISCLSFTQPCSNVLHTFTYAPHNSFKLFICTLDDHRLLNLSLLQILPPFCLFYIAHIGCSSIKFADYDLTLCFDAR